MEQRSTSPTRQRRPGALALLLGALLLMGLCYGLYEFSPLGWVYFFLNEEHFTERVEALVPEYNALNETVMASLPVYPRATMLPQTLTWKGPSTNPVPPGGPGGPPHLRVCFSTDDTLKQVGEFYHQALQQEGWKVNTNVLGYSKGQACVVIHHVCWAEVESESNLVYQVIVKHDINTLLGFPHIPKIMYWLDEVGHCP